MVRWFGLVGAFCAPAIAFAQAQQQQPAWGQQPSYPAQPRQQSAWPAPAGQPPQQPVQPVQPQAQAQPQQPAYGPYHRPPNARDEWGTQQGSRTVRPASGDYVHDGFYLRFAGGLGGGSDKLNGTGHTSEGAGSSLDGTAKGFAAATELAIGLTPFRGLVLGIAIDTVTVPSGSATLGDSGRFEFGTSQAALYGVLIDYYWDPLRGFHLQASGGVASYIMAQGNSADGQIAPPHAALGGGLCLGVGNQWWIHRDWTLGVLPRLLLAWTNGTDEFGSSYSHRFIGYSLLLSATYH